MKKALMFLIIAFMALSLLSCTGQKQEEAKAPQVEQKATEAVQDTAAQADTTQAAPETPQKAPEE